jgi:hypothetical protein
MFEHNSDSELLITLVIPFGKTPVLLLLLKGI